MHSKHTLSKTLINFNNTGIKNRKVKWKYTNTVSICLRLSDSLSGEVLMPSGKSAQPLITDNLDGTVTVQYSPTEAGLHEMHIKYNGTHIPGQHTTHTHTH